MVKTTGKSGKKLRKFKGLWIPAALLECSKFTAAEKLIFAEVDSLDVDGKGCFASNDHFAKILGNTAKNASRVINLMVEKELLASEVIVGEKGRLNRRFLKIRSAETESLLSPKVGSRLSPEVGSRLSPEAGIRLSPEMGGGLPRSGDQTIPRSGEGSPQKWGSYNKEEVYNERYKGEREKQTLPPSPESLAQENFKTISACAGLPDDFLQWFEAEVLGRFDKYILSAVELRDWHERFFLIFDEDVCIEAICSYREQCPQKKWRPDFGAIKKSAAAAHRKIELAKEATHKVKKTKHHKSIGEMYAERPIADLLEEYRRNPITRESVHRNAPELDAKIRELLQKEVCV